MPFKSDKAYYRLLADIGVLDDLEDWEQYQSMSDLAVENLDDDTVMEHFDPSNRQFKF